MSEVTVEQLEQQRRDNDELMARRDAALRLAENKDFRRLFIKEYFVEEAARLVQLSGDPALTPQQQADSLEMAKATGHCKRYLSVIVQQAAKAESDNEDIDDMLREVEAAEDQAEIERNEGSVQ
jgi:hypothetical protein